ncbi:hypothetical protein ACFWNT_29060 [Streptomyces sp. NPDC058409]|uniref:hypothetical protein n=1 Tax=Streptomyces sp. NPDC058409 TaxID=3346484 RepID=UPI0036598102
MIAVVALAAAVEVLRSPYDPERILPTFDGGDRLHPSDKGMQAPADPVRLGGPECHRTGG